jgi:hypothetical protein
VVGTGHNVDFGDFAGRLEVTSHDLTVDTDGSTHFHHQNSVFFSTGSLGLNNPCRIDFSLKIFFPNDLLTNPREDSSQSLYITSIRSTHVCSSELDGGDGRRKTANKS